MRTLSQVRAGHGEHCDTAFAEPNGATPDAPAQGGFATHLAVSERRVMPMLASLSDEQGALVEPTAVTFHAVKRTAMRLGSVVAVMGAGRVLISEPVDARRRSAHDLGFDDVFEPGDAFRAAIGDATNGLGADVLFECTGVARHLQPAAEMVRRGGTVSLLGYPTTESSVSYGDWRAVSSPSSARWPTTTRTSSGRCGRSRRGAWTSAH